MMNTPAALNQYLQRHGEPESALLHSLPSISVDYCIAIPCRNERSMFLHHFIQDFEQLNALVIVVVNSPPSQLDQSENNNFITSCKKLFPQALWKHQHLELRARGTLKLLIVERLTNHPIPPEEGVGLARKIACDIACQLYLQTKIKVPWVYSTDADARLPANYFAEDYSQYSPRPSAVVFDFTHIATNDNTGSPAQNQACFEATRLYEASLKYFCKGLNFAGSPYAFYTLGSTLGISLHHYAQVHGFPKRAGAEDFYLLNKLAKVGQVLTQYQICVNILARESRRVPFGTGPAVDKILDHNYCAENYPYYNAGIFVELRLWLELLPQLWQFVSTQHEDVQNLDKILPKPLFAVSQQLKLPVFLQHASQQCKNYEAFERHFHQWFDAFKTLKFVHYLQSHGYPTQGLKQATLQLDTNIKR